MNLASLNHANLKGADLMGANLDDVTAYETNFEDANLTDDQGGHPPPPRIANEDETSNTETKNINRGSFCALFRLV